MTKDRPWGRMLGLALSAGTALAQQPPLAAKLLPARSEISFVSKQMGVPVEGKFTRFDAQIVLDPRAPETGRVALAIDTGSAAFGAPELDSELPKPTWFDTPKFPQATFQSNSIKAAGTGKFEVTGTLAIKGVSRDVRVPVALARGADNVSTASGSFTIKRLDFKIGDGEWADASLLANDVQVKFKLALSGLPSY